MKRTKRARRRRTTIVAVSLFALLFVLGAAPLAYAQQRNSAQAVEQLIAEASTRLKLTTDQQVKISPLIQQSEEQLKAARAKYGDAPSKQQKREMLKDARGIQKSFQAQVEPLLTADQKAEWAKMKSEAKEKLRDRVQEKRAANS